MLWHPTLTTGLLPFLALLYMNSQIFLTVRYVNCEVVFYKEIFFSRDILALQEDANHIQRKRKPSTPWRDELGGDLLFSC